jgi:hypothetical protein
MQELEEKIAKLFETARKLPPGDVRQDILKEIGSFRMRLDAISARTDKIATREVKVV